jgi:hypothetical protein
MDIQKMLKDTTDHANFATWQGSLYALREVKLHVDSEIKKYEELMKSTETGKTLSNIGAI